MALLGVLGHLKNMPRNWISSTVRTNLAIMNQRHPGYKVCVRCFSSPSPNDDASKPPKTHQPKPRQPITWSSVGIAAVIGGVLVGYVLYLQKEKDAEIAKETKRIMGKAKIGGGFELVDHNGVPRKSTDFIGKWLLIYFGFTHCPDICPDEIEKLCKAVDALEASKIQVQPLFISVDPARDTVPLVAKYVKEFSPKLLGLTGTVEKVAECCKAYRIYFSAGPRDQEDDYIVDHSVIVYLVNPDGDFVDYFGQTKTYEDIYKAVMISVSKYNARSSKWLNWK